MQGNYGNDRKQYQNVPGFSNKIEGLAGQCLT